MTRPVRFRPRAALDLREIAAFIARDNPARAVSFTAELRDRADALGAFPQAWPSRPELGADIRMMPAGRYIVLFRETAEAVIVIRILHAARMRRA